MSEIKKLILKIEEKDDKLLVTIGAPEYVKRGDKLKATHGDVSAYLLSQGYEGVVSLQNATYKNFGKAYEQEVVWVYTHKAVKPEPVKKPVAKKKPVVKKKTVPKKETPKPKEG